MIFTRHIICLAIINFSNFERVKLTQNTNFMLFLAQ